MGRNRIGLQFNGWKELLSGIEKASGESGLKQATEAGLKASKAFVNQNVDKIMKKSNMPAHGDYWTGETKESLDKNFDVEWHGYTAETKVGFNMAESGLTSIFLMYGTPRRKPSIDPVPGLYEAIYGKKTKKEVAEIQKEAINKYIQRNLGG